MGAPAPAHRLALDSRLSSLDSSGFTLTELLVVMVILTLLTVMTVWAVNFSLAAERSRAAARQVQSYLEGARDRAIYERRPVGVRFLIDPNVADTLSSMIYIEEIVPPTGNATVRTDANGNWIAVRESGQPTWTSLQRKGLLAPGVKIRIPDNDTGFWYTVQTVDVSDPANETVTFEPTYRESGTPPFPGKTFRLKLPPVVRPNQEPMLLPRGIVVDVERSQLPRAWATAGDQLDVMFSPRGTVTGRPAAGGLIHFYLAETADVERLASWSSTGDIPADVAVGTPAELPGDRLIVTLFPQTGAISSHPVDVRDPDNNDVADDPFFFAETGEVAGE